MFFICLIVPFAGTFSWLHFQKKEVKKRVKKELISQLDKKELIFLKFSIPESKSKLNWEHSKEFEYEGMMYDIVKAETGIDSVSYWCWPDHEETALNKTLNKLVDIALGTNQKSKENRQNLADFIKLLYPPGVFRWLATSAEPERCKFISCSFIYSSRSQDPPVPPPEIA